jgi:two-component system, OmpR family, sensor histidine kinase CreC
MHLGLRLLFGFLVITGLAAFFVMRVFVAEVQPSVREVMEDILVDTANLLAEDAAADLAALPPGGDLRGSRFAAAVQAYASRPVDAQIWGLNKRHLDLRVYLTDRAGRVVLDEGANTTGLSAVGQDYSRWRDVARTLRGEYGARATREVKTDANSSVMYVAAPVRGPNGEVIGVLTVAKAQATVAPFVERAERKILHAGVLLLGLSLAIGVAVTLWAVRAVRRLRRYAQLAGSEPGTAVAAPPALPGELGELARAMGAMRARLEGREQREQLVRAMTHELKGPLAAIRGASELLADELPPADRARFASQIDGQVRRLAELVDRLLELSKLESLQALEHREPVELGALTDALLADHAARLQQRGLSLRWAERVSGWVGGDRQRLALAVSNLLANAAAFAPPGSALTLSLRVDGGTVVWQLRDTGPGVPDFALPHLGERFYATARPDGGKGSGLGLAIVRQVMALHGGTLAFEPAAPGLRVSLRLPRVPAP